MLKVILKQTAMGFNGATIGEVVQSQSVHILANVTIGDALIQNWRNEVKQYYDEINQGKFSGDEITIASNKDYEVKLRAVNSYRFQILM